MYKLIISFLLVSFWSQSSFATYKQIKDLKDLSERPFMSKSDVDHFMHPLVPWTSQIALPDLSELPVLVKEVVQLKGENQYGSFKAAAIIWSTATHYKNSEDVKPDDVKYWYQLVEVVEQSSINKGLLNVLEAIMYDGCSNAVSGWIRRKTGYVTENHRFCQNYVIPKFLEYTNKSADDREFNEIALNSRVLLNALIDNGYECSEYLSVLQYPESGLSYTLDNTLSYLKSGFGLTLSDMKWEIIYSNFRKNR